MHKKKSLISVAIVITLLMITLISELQAETVFTSVQLEIDETPGPLDCSFNKLSTLIGHNDFSILGMHQNCAIFYILGDNIRPGNKVDLSEIPGSLNRCQTTEPLFYKHNDEYQILVTQKSVVYSGECKWQKLSNIYHTCPFDRKVWKKHSIRPSTSDDMEILGHITDVNSNVLHVFHSDENGMFYDSTYDISSEKFIKQGVLQQKHLKKLSYDSDRQFMYMLTNEMVYQKVKSNSGIFIYEPTYSKVKNFSRGSYSTFSFSNSYYIIKKILGDGRIAYYAGKEGNPDQVCIAELLPDETFYISLLVGADSESVYEQIRNQIAPKPLPVQPDSQTTSTPVSSARPSFRTFSLILFTLLSFVISR